MKSGEGRVESGEWRVENVEWKVENGEYGSITVSFFFYEFVFL